MNLQSENKPTANTALSKLKQCTETAIKTVEETPYRPIVYAIPERIWEDFFKYMKASAEFQPNMYEKFAALEGKVATQEDLTQMWAIIEEWSGRLSRDVKTSAGSIVPKVQDLLAENKETLLQDGRKREQFFSKLNTATESYTEAFSALISEMKRWIIGAIAGSAALSALTAALISLLMK